MKIAAIKARRFVPTLFCPDFNGIPVCRQAWVVLHIAVEITLEACFPQQHDQIMSIDPVCEASVGKVMALCFLGDAGLKRALDRIPGEIICTILVSRFGQSTRLTCSQGSKSLKVSAAEFQFLPSQSQYYLVSIILVEYTNPGFTFCVLRMHCGLNDVVLYS
jgi:hypothetical protein